LQKENENEVEITVMYSLDNDSSHKTIATKIQIWVLLNFYSKVSNKTRRKFKPKDKGKTKESFQSHTLARIHCTMEFPREAFFSEKKGLQRRFNDKHYSDWQFSLPNSKKTKMKLKIKPKKKNEKVIAPKQLEKNFPRKWKKALPKKQLQRRLKDKYYSDSIANFPGNEKGKSSLTIKREMEMKKKTQSL
jgi:hypothetical protein